MYKKDWSEKVKAAHDLHYAMQEERVLFDQVKLVGTLAQDDQLPDLYVRFGNACLLTQDALKRFDKAKS